MKSLMEVLINWGKDALSEHGPGILTGIATLLIGWMVAKLLSLALKRILKGGGVDATLSVFFANLAYVTMLTLVVITVLDRFGFPAVSFAAVVGAAGLAIGLALKGALSNLAAGVMLIALRPFNVGDRIDAAGVSGVVSHIQVFATTIQAENQKKFIIPNATLTGGIITNHTGK